MPRMFEAAQTIQKELPGVTFLVPVSLPDFKAVIADAMDAYGLNGRLVDKEHGESGDRCCRSGY